MSGSDHRSPDADADGTDAQQLLHLSIEELEALAKADVALARPAHLDACAECTAELAWLQRERQLFAARSAHADQPAGASANDSNEVAERLWAGVAARIDGIPVATWNDGPRASAAAPVSKRARLADASASHARVHAPAWHRRRRSLSALAIALPAALVLIIALSPSSPLSRRAALSPTAPGEPGSRATAPGAALLDPRGNANHASDALDSNDDELDVAPDPRVAQALERAELDTAHAVQVLEAEAATLRPKLHSSAANGFDRSLQSARERLDAARLTAANDSEGREDLQARMRMLGGYTRYLRSLQTMVRDIEESRP